MVEGNVRMWKDMDDEKLMEMVEFVIRRINWRELSITM